MRVSREQAEQNRERIVETAATLFREKGFDGIGVADLMKSAGLTHGGFYGHFASKEDLLAEAAAHALKKSVARWEGYLAEDRHSALDKIGDGYLTAQQTTESADLDDIRKRLQALRLPQSRPQ